VCRRTGHTMVEVRLLPLPQHLIHLSSQFAAPKPNLPILGSYKIDPNAKKAGFLNGGTFALEVSESFYTLTTELDFGASGGGVVDIETKINRRSQQLTSGIVGGKSGYFAQYPLGGMCFEDRPWPGIVF
jgi:hypothetical protein